MGQRTQDRRLVETVCVYSSETLPIDNLIDTPPLTDCSTHKHTRICAARIAISTQTYSQSPYGKSRNALCVITPVTCVLNFVNA